MAFLIGNLSLLSPGGNGPGVNGVQLPDLGIIPHRVNGYVTWGYISSTDGLAAIAANGFFDAMTGTFQPGDRVEVTVVDNVVSPKTLIASTTLIVNSV